MRANQILAKFQTLKSSHSNQDGINTSIETDKLEVSITDDIVESILLVSELSQAKLASHSNLGSR